MTKSQELKFNAIENTDVIVGIDIAKNVHWAGGTCLTDML